MMHCCFKLIQYKDDAISRYKLIILYVNVQFYRTISTSTAFMYVRFFR
jgi:hypothetical protein